MNHESAEQPDIYSLYNKVRSKVYLRTFSKIFKTINFKFIAYLIKCKFHNIIIGVLFCDKPTAPKKVLCSHVIFSNLTGMISSSAIHFTP